MLADLDVDVLSRVLRPTMISALVVGAFAAGIAFLISSPPAVFGIGIGVGVAILNLRVLASGVAKIDTKGAPDNKVVRRILRTRSALRLLIITALAIGLAVLSPPLGIGMVVGLVIFQIAFIINAGRVILRTGIV